MDTLLLPMLIAGAVALGIWAVVRALTNEEARERRRLAQRLSSEGRGKPNPGQELRSITLRPDAAAASQSLAGRPGLSGLNRRVVQAYPGMTLNRFLAFAAAAGCCGFFLGFVLMDSPLVGLIGGAVGFYIPFFLLNRKRSKRQRLMAEQLPEALDFLSRVLKAGHSFSTGLQMMADELPQPLAGEFRRCYDQHSLGQPLEDALKEAAIRVESSDFAFFVTALLIQRQTGGDLSEVLKNISGMIRSRVRLAQQVKAKTAEGRFTGYILVAFPGVMFLLVWVQAPQQATKMVTGTGLYLLGTAFGLQMLGLWAIKKITTVRV